MLFSVIHTEITLGTVKTRRRLPCDYGVLSTVTPDTKINLNNLNFKQPANIFELLPFIETTTFLLAAHTKRKHKSRTTSKPHLFPKLART